jgi:hypothetical protein
MPGNGSMNDAWLGQTVKPPKTEQISPEDYMGMGE